MKHLTRREMLKLMAAAAAGGVLAACSKATEAPLAQPTKAPESAKAPDATKVPESTKAPEATKAPAATNTPEPTAVPPKAEPIEVKLVECWFGLPQYQDVLDPINDLISEKMQSEGLNIRIKSIVLDDHQNQYPALYSTQADFTMAWDAQWVIMNQLRDDGSIIPIEDLLQQYGPNVLAKYDAPVLEFNRYNKDKHLYGLPIFGIYGETVGMYMREDLRAKYGVALPEGNGTLAAWRSLEPYLEAIKANEGKMIPFGNTTRYSLPGNSVTAYDDGSPSWALGLQGAGAFGLGILDCRDPKFENSEDMPGGTDAAAILRDWWERGLINKDDINPTTSMEAEFLATGKIGAQLVNGPETGRSAAEAQLKQNFPDASLAAIDMTGLMNGKQKPLGGRKQWNWYVWNANAPQEQQIAGMQFMDWIMSSDENIDLWTFGVDGKNYKAEPDRQFSEIEGVDPTTNYRREWYISGVPMKYLRVPTGLSEVEKKLRAVRQDVNQWRFAGPFETFTWDWDSKAVEELSAKLNAVAAEANFGLITGQMPTDEGVKKLKELLDGAGRQEMKDALNKQLDEFIKANQSEVDAWLSANK